MSESSSFLTIFELESQFLYGYIDQLRRAYSNY
jgi:hypothetical protein